ncbi:V4R domain-containing protein [Pyrococcus sp. ST04]|uniref:V4R domain-containing protein n=1 Tax=Pyrococcus sp. ST04 TaxID=1183377 RepID=UPI0002605FED|nr:V4R domain-containing protein [Pyrococcus sp. ST04]AFK22740.1 hypothetical protein Py04_1166 [Pyrococcus sp. ST04]
MPLRSNITVLDQILGGGFEKGHNIALVGGIDNDYVLLLHQLVMSFLNQGLKVLLIEFRQDVSTLVKWLASYGIDYSKYIEKGKLKILDGFSNLYSPTHVSGTNILPNPMDLSITTAIIRDSVVKEAYDFVVIDDLSSLYALQTDQKAYVRIIVRLINSIKRMGASSLVGINSDVLTIQDLSMMLIPFEYLFEIKDSQIRIIRSLRPLMINQRTIPYLRTKTGIIPMEDAFKNIEHVKGALVLDKNGVLLMGNVRVQIIEEYSESALIEFIYNFLGPEKGREFLYNWGKYEVGRLQIERSLFEGLSQEEAMKKILEDSFEFTKATGGGELKIVEITKDRVVIEGKNLFPGLRSFPYPVHMNYAGAFAGLLEKITGKTWKGEEIQCEGQGHRKCVFLLRVAT